MSRKAFSFLGSIRVQSILCLLICFYPMLYALCSLLLCPMLYSILSGERLGHELSDIHHLHFAFFLFS